jgi:hypothetical protein
MTVTSARRATARLARARPGHRGTARPRPGPRHVPPAGGAAARRRRRRRARHWHTVARGRIPESGPGGVPAWA